MARLNIYLPDELAAQARDANLNLSAVAQEALRETLAARSTDVWLATLGGALLATVPHDQALGALDEYRGEPSTRHG